MKNKYIKVDNFFVPKGGFLSESNGIFSNCPKNVPKTIMNYYINHQPCDSKSQKTKAKNQESTGQYE